MILRFIKITGHSLEPTYREGDYVLIGAVPFPAGSIFPGDVVVFRHAALGLLIKRVEQVLGDAVLVLGTHPDSVDSRSFGPIPLSDVLGKVIWHIVKRD